MARNLVLTPELAGNFLPDTSASNPAAREPKAESCDRLYWALDGRDFVVLGKRWHVEVFSVVELVGRRYVQLSLDGPDQYMVTLRLLPITPLSRAISAIVAWLARPTCSGDIVDVR